MMLTKEKRLKKNIFYSSKFSVLDTSHLEICLFTINSNFFFLFRFSLAYLKQPGKPSKSTKIGITITCVIIFGFLEEECFNHLP